MINKNNYKQNIFEYKITPPPKKKKKKCILFCIPKQRRISFSNGM